MCRAYDIFVGIEKSWTKENDSNFSIFVSKKMEKFIPQRNKIERSKLIFGRRGKF